MKPIRHRSQYLPEQIRGADLKRYRDLLQCQQAKLTLASLYFADVVLADFGVSCKIDLPPVSSPAQ